MTFLELCERAAVECGSSSVPTSVVSQSGEAQRFVNWVSQSWMDIQQAARWDWLQDDFSFQTTASDGDYTPTQAGITRFKTWVPDTFRIYLTADGQATEQYLIEQDWDWFRDVYLFGGQASQTGRPTQYAIRPHDRAIVLGDKPNGIYTVTGRYWKSAQTLAADADEPEGIPEEFQMLIVYRAMLKYAGYESAAEVLATARGEYRTMMMRMTEQCLPRLTLGATLA